MAQKPVTMTSFLGEIVSWGIGDQATNQEASQIRFTNALLLGLVVASIGQTAVLFWSGAREAALINTTAPFVFGSGLALMRQGYTRAARMLVLTIAYFAGYVIATILGPESQFQLVLLFGSALALSFFSFDEWKSLVYGLLLPIGCLLGLELTGFAPVLGLQRITLSPERLLVLRVSTVTVLWTTVIGLFAYHVRARKRSQEQLISSAKLVALGQMAAGIAHEVNNPLSSIASDAQMLANLATRGNVPAGEATRLSKRMVRTSMRIGAIVRGLLSLSRDASHDPLVVVPVQKLVELTLGYCRARMESSGIELRVRAIESGLTVTGRETQLSEVLLNVLNNALYATADLTERWIEIAVQDAPAFIEIAVTDSGPGISRDVQRRMFDPFFTSKPVGQGTGLGLSVSRAIVIAHKGQLEYDDASDRTRFVIRLPRAGSFPG
jgi:signal transduction histidine kinase